MGGGGGCAHHPAPAGFYPCHSTREEIGGGAEVLLLDGWKGDGGGEGHVYGYGVFVVKGADLLIGHVCAGLGLRAGDRGCGWGGLFLLHVVRLVSRS